MELPLWYRSMGSTGHTVSVGGGGGGDTEPTSRGTPHPVVHAVVLAIVQGILLFVTTCAS